VRFFLADKHIYKAMTPCQLVKCCERWGQLQEV